MKLTLKVLMAASLLLLIGCGGSGNGNDSEPVVTPSEELKNSIASSNSDTETITTIASDVAPDQEALESISGSGTKVEIDPTDSITNTQPTTIDPNDPITNTSQEENNTTQKPGDDI